MLNFFFIILIIFILVIILIFPFLLAIVVLVISQILALKRPKDQEKHSPFECGFIP